MAKDPGLNVRADAELRRYLEMIAALTKGNQRPKDYVHKSVEAYVLAYGHSFFPRHLPNGVEPMRVKECYENAYRLAKRTKAFHYVEGFALGVIPMHHAWCITQEGYVVDPTWASSATGLGTAYIGVELDLEQVKLSRQAGCASLLEDFNRRYPALRGCSVTHPDPWFVQDEFDLGVK